jgi:hypothetical protein
VRSVISLSVLAFGFLLLATLAIHVINHRLRRPSTWNTLLLVLGCAVLVLMGVQFYRSQRELIRIHEQIDWREPDAEQRKRLIFKLTAFAGQQYMLAGLPPNREAMNFAGSLDQILENAGWVKFRGPYPDAAALNKRRDEKGIEIKYPPNREAALKPVAQALATALEQEDIAAYTAPNSTLDSTPGVIGIQSDERVR